MRGNLTRKFKKKSNQDNVALNSYTQLSCLNKNVFTIYK